jgi:hypothetical protein
MKRPAGPASPATPATPAGARSLLPAIVLVLFAAPLAVAFWLYYGSNWRPSLRTNHGQLIEPVVVLPRQALPSALGASAPAPVALRGKWSLVVIGAGESGCDADCRGALVYARQTWLSLAELRDRVQRVLLAGAGCCDEAYLLREHEGLRVARAADAAAAATADAPADAPAGTAAAALLRAFPQPHRGGIFIVDPLGNLMMRYDVRQDPKGLRVDLKKLLELSHIG